MISQEGLEEFKQIYFEEFGVELSNEEILEKALPILNLVKTLTQSQSNILIKKDPVDLESEKVSL